MVVPAGSTYGGEPPGPSSNGQPLRSAVWFEPLNSSSHSSFESSTWSRFQSRYGRGKNSLTTICCGYGVGVGIEQLAAPGVGGQSVTQFGAPSGKRA